MFLPYAAVVSAASTTACDCRALRLERTGDGIALVYER